jgi:hypothetical protein
MFEEPDFGFENAGDYASRRTHDRRRTEMPDGLHDMHTYKGRKRARGFRHSINDDDDQPAPVTSTKKGIKIGNSKDVWDFYEQRFKNCQQTACKLIAKAWVKAVEPKKQSNHPYTGSDEKAPDWWPKPWGPTKDDKVRHKEPDHLYKRGTSAMSLVLPWGSAYEYALRTCASAQPHSQNDSFTEQ